MTRTVPAMVCFLLSASCVSTACGPPTPVDSRYSEPLHIRGTTLWVELAVTPEERHRGLMYRRELPEDRGMLFIYPQAETRYFYMKNTYIPLSLAYISDDGRIFQIEEMKPLDETTVPSKRPARFVLEMRLGWFRDHAVSIGDRVEGLDRLLESIGPVRR